MSFFFSSFSYPHSLYFSPLLFLLSTPLFSSFSPHSFASSPLPTLFSLCPLSPPSYVCILQPNPTQPNKTQTNFNQRIINSTQTQLDKRNPLKPNPTKPNTNPTQPNPRRGPVGRNSLRSDGVTGTRILLRNDGVCCRDGNHVCRHHTPWKPHLAQAPAAAAGLLGRGSTSTRERTRKAKTTLATTTTQYTLRGQQDFYPRCIFGYREVLPRRRPSI